MTESPPGNAWLPTLETIIRSSVHETRNSLNGLLVNLEVVRSRLARSQGDGSTNPDVLSFAEQAVDQAESLARLNDGLSALLSLITGCMGTDGIFHASTAGTARTISFDIDSTVADTLLPRLKGLADSAGFLTERRGGSVIFTVPAKSGTELRHQE